MTLAINLLVLGLIVTLGSFVSFILGMVSCMKPDSMEDLDFPFSKGFKQCLYSMVVFAVGGVIEALGLYYGAYSLIAPYIQ